MPLMSFNKTRFSRKPKIFYGYRIVFVAFLCIFLDSGIGLYSFSLFLKALQADFGWSRGEIMVAHTVRSLTAALAAPLVGRLVDRYGAKKVMFAGAIINGSGFVFLTQVNNLWQFYLGYAIVGIGMTAMGMVAASTIISSWFQKKRGFAIGIAGMGAGGGGFFIAPLVGGLLIPGLGWRGAYLVLAFIIWGLIIPLALLVLKTKPADMGLYPDGAEAPQAADGTKAAFSAPAGLTLKMALVTSAFWLIVTSWIINLFNHVAVIQTQYPYLEDVGFPAATAAAVLGTVGLFSGFGKFVFGWLCDRMPARYAGVIGLSFQTIGLVILMNVKPESPAAAMWLYAIMMGLGIGSQLPILVMLTTATFGLANFGSIYGTVSLFNSTGSATGPLVAGYMYDAMNTYNLFFIIMLVLYVIGIAAVFLVRRPKSLQV